MEQTREKIALTYSMEQTEGRITLINMEPTVGLWNNIDVYGTVFDKYH